jgi:hypothetical protein
MVSVKLTQNIGPNILTWGLGRSITQVYQRIRELIKMNSTITKIINMVSNN